MSKLLPWLFRKNKKSPVRALKHGTVTKDGAVIFDVKEIKDSFTEKDHADLKKFFDEHRDK